MKSCEPEYSACGLSFSTLPNWGETAYISGMKYGQAHAGYASHPDKSRGRLHAESDSKTRTPFQRDRDRVLHCSAFRRLKHKTQVFVAHVGDYYRTRLTHSLEVAQIGRSIARELEIDEDLTETLSLAHDLGHTPFGHAGEDALHLAMQPYGGFDHNAQTLRILTELEARYVPFNGLNLTWETLEGLVKHNGPLLVDETKLSDLPFAIQAYAEHQDLQLGTWPSLEAQIAALSDDIAYNNHDIDDGLRAGLIRLEDLAELKMTGTIIKSTSEKYGDISIDLQRHELVREMISIMIGDLVTETRKRLANGSLQTCDDVRHAGLATAAFSDALQNDLVEVRAFLMEHVYKHHTVNRSMSKARRIIGEMFELLISEPNLLPDAEHLMSKDPRDQARHICDYIAGMTDKFAIEEHHRLFDITDSLA